MAHYVSKSILCHYTRITMLFSTFVNLQVRRQALSKNRQSSWVLDMATLILPWDLCGVGMHVLTHWLGQPLLELNKASSSDGREMVWFMLFNDTWSQEGHSVLCMTILFLNLQITRLDIRPHIKWAVSLVITYSHFNLPQGFVWVCMG